MTIHDPLSFETVASRAEAPALRPLRQGAEGTAAALKSLCAAGLARCLLLGVALTGTGAVLSLAAAALAVDGLGPLDGLALLLALLPTLWISWACGHSVLGFVGRRLRWRPAGLKPASPRAPLTTRTAIAMPVYEEEPAAWGANLMTLGEELASLGLASHFDIFVLSDTRSEAVAAAEGGMQARLAASLPMAVHYRRRAENVGRKAGNLADFARRWASRYDHFLILDADSLMSAHSVAMLVRTMQANPGAGLLQTAPRLARRHSLFARLQQFSTALMGPIAATGQALWQGSEGNFWGHNALVRSSAWVACAQLPRLAGDPPWGGDILSHDFVEAALLRRGGWGVWMLPELGGSWEETPPSLLDHLSRERRWCQGNLQHLRVLCWPRLHPVSRVHLALGIASYLIAPLWLALVVAGALLGANRLLVPDPFFASGALAASATLLFLPKTLAVLDACLDARRRRGMGGMAAILGSTAAETLVTFLLAPAVLLFHARSLADLLRGRDSGWARQRRSEACVGLGELLIWFRGHLLAASLLVLLAIPAATGAGTVWLLLPAVAWASAPLLAWATAHPTISAATRSLFRIPEERRAPETIGRAEALRRELSEPLSAPTPPVRGVPGGQRRRRRAA